MTVRELVELNANNKFFLNDPFGDDFRQSEIYIEIYIDEIVSGQVFHVTKGSIYLLYAVPEEEHAELWDKQVKKYYLEWDPFDASTVKMLIQI